MSKRLSEAFLGNQDNQYRPFIRLTDGIVSGNARAFRDLIKYKSEIIGIYGIARYLNLICPDLFAKPLAQEIGYGAGGLTADALQKHERLVHCAMSIKFICDRGVTHEIVRHRPPSYAQESTRYCNYKGGVTFIIPCWLYEYVKEGDYPQKYSYSAGPQWANWLFSMLDAEKKYVGLLDQGWTPQQARSVLPNSLKTEIVMTANLQEWVHFFKLRCDKKAHPQMQEVANMALVFAKQQEAEIFGNME